MSAGCGRGALQVAILRVGAGCGRGDLQAASLRVGAGCGRGDLQVASLRVGAGCAADPGRLADVGELALATDPGCWADEGELALEPSRPLVCRVTAASVSVRELIPEQLLGEEADPSACPPRWDVAAPLVSGAVCLPINGCRPSLIVCQSARMNSQPTIGELSGAHNSTHGVR